MQNISTDRVSVWFSHLPFEVVIELCSNTFGAEVYSHINLIMTIS